MRTLLLYCASVEIDAVLPHRSFFFFNDTATTEIYTLSLHDALPIYPGRRRPPEGAMDDGNRSVGLGPARLERRSEEHTSELQSRQYLVCRLLLEKKNTRSSSDHRTTRCVTSTSTISSARRSHAT